MVAQLVGKVEEHTKEIRDLWGRLNSISVGSKVFPPPNQVPTAVTGAVIVGTALGWGLVPVSVPGSAVLRNVFGVDQGDTAPSYKAIFDATAPTTIAPSDAATAGTSLSAAHRDHRHGAPATYPATAHNILSVTHGDTVAAAVVRGDLMVGNSTPAWARVAKGAAGSVLRGDGTDTAWTINPAIAGWGRFGSAANPANTTAGDLTTVRHLNTGILQLSADRVFDAMNATTGLNTIRATNNGPFGPLIEMEDATAFWGIQVTAGDLYLNRDASGNFLQVSHTSGAFQFQTSVAVTNSTPINTTNGDLSALRGLFGADIAMSAILTVNQATLGNEVFRLISTATSDDPTEKAFQNRVTTADATVTTLHTVTIPASTTVMIEARVVARRTGGSAGTAEDGAGYVVYATVKNIAGTATLIGAVTSTVAQEDQAGWDATIDVTAATARVRVTGAVNNNVTWHVTLRTWAVGS